VLIFLYTDVKCHIEIGQPKLLAKLATVASSGDANKVNGSEKQRCGLDLFFKRYSVVVSYFLYFSFSLTVCSNLLIIKGCKNGDFWWPARFCYG
jgi:hypothetical protein